MRDTLKAAFIYHFESYSPDGVLLAEWEQRNLIPDAGRDYLLNSALNGASQLSTWYIGLFGANRTPASADTMTLFLADCDESTAYTTTANARLALTPDALSGGVWSNVGTKAEFTFASADSIYGAFITSGGTRASTAGLLLSATKFDTMQAQPIGSILRVSAGLSFVTI